MRPKNTQEEWGDRPRTKAERSRRVVQGPTHIRIRFPLSGVDYVFIPLVLHSISVLIVSLFLRLAFLGGSKCHEPTCGDRLGMKGYRLLMNHNAPSRYDQVDILETCNNARLFSDIVKHTVPEGRWQGREGPDYTHKLCRVRGNVYSL